MTWSQTMKFPIYYDNQSNELKHEALLGTLKPKNKYLEKFVFLNGTFRKTRNVLI